MTMDLETYKLTDGQTPLSAETFNPRFYAIVRRLHALETVVIDWNAAVSQVQNYGLQRINESIKPLLDSLKADLQALIDQGEAALHEQDAAVTAKLAEVDTRIAVIQAILANFGSAMDGVIEVGGQLTKELVTVDGVAKILLTALVPEPPEVPITDPAQLEYLLW